MIPIRDTANSVVYRYSLLTPPTTVAQVQTSPTLTYLYFQLNYLDQYTSYTAIYDQYRIDKVDVTFWPQFRANSMAQTGAVVPLIYVVVDLDDASAPTSIGFLEQYQNCVVRNDERAFTVSFQPHVALAAYRGGFTGFANAGNQWIDSASPDIAHYGIKLGITPQNTSVSQYQQWTITTRLHVSFRNVR